MLIFVLAILATFTQVIFSPDKVTGWVKEELTKKEFTKGDLNIDFDRAQTSVLASISHPLGVRIKGLKIKFTKDCKVFSGYFETLTVPFHIGKAFKKKIDLGLVRLNGGDFKITNSCPEVIGPNKIKVGKASPFKKERNDVEKDLLKILEQLAVVDLDFLEDSEQKLKYKGALFYDLRISFNDSELLIDRMKTLFGKGEVEADGEWTSTLKVSDEESLIYGQFKILKESVDVSINFEEKEAKLKADLKVKRRDVGDGMGSLTLEVEDFPLSIISRFKEYQVMDLNLRKSWLDLSSSFEFDKELISATAKMFKVHGEFGEMELRPGGFSALWSGLRWKQEAPSEFKLKDIDIEKLVGVTPKKKVQGVFGDFGKFNAFLKFDNLNTITGDFETKDFSILFRSMGKSFSQKGEYARGVVEYVIDKKLVVMLNEVGITDGDFEGFVRLDYAYSDKQIRTSFEIPHFRLSPQIYKELFKIKVGGDLKISGSGKVYRKSLLKDKHKSADGEINFKLKSSGASFDYWDLKEVESDCSLVNKVLKCRLMVESLVLSDALLEKAGIQKRSFEDLVSENLELKDKNLRMSLASETDKFELQWNSKVGVQFLGLGEGGADISARELD